MIFTSVLKAAQQITHSKQQQRKIQVCYFCFIPSCLKKKTVPTFMNPLNGVKRKSNKVTIKNNLGFWTDDIASSTSLSSMQFFIQDCFLVPCKFPVHLSQLLFRQHAFHLLLCIYCRKAQLIAPVCHYINPFFTCKLSTVCNSCPLI